MLAESLNGQNPTGRLHSEALRRMLWALKMEIPVYFVVVSKGRAEDRVLHRRVFLLFHTVVQGGSQCTFFEAGRTCLCS